MWAPSVRSGVNVSKPRYRHAHQQERKRWAPVVAAGDAYCAEPVCLMKSRWIPPNWATTQLWHLCHDPSGTIVIGVGHRKCNLSEAAKRGNKMRSRKAKPPPTKKRPTNRWVL